MPRLRPTLLVLPLAAALILLPGALDAARAGDVVVFVALPSPADAWGRGYGAALSSTWFRVLTFEGEAARVRGETLGTAAGSASDRSLTSFTASALLSPPIGGVIPYGGLGVGLFRQTLGSASDTGRLKALVLGVKLRVKDLLVLKGEYRRLELSGNPLLPMDSRVSFGAGIAF
jgi:hypothetical protein